MTDPLDVLPPLPPMIALSPDPSRRQFNPQALASMLPAMGHTDDQMRSYGLSCFRAGMERAAKITESILFAKLGASRALTGAEAAKEAAAAIRQEIP